MIKVSMFALALLGFAAFSAPAHATCATHGLGSQQFGYAPGNWCPQGGGFVQQPMGFIVVQRPVPRMLIERICVPGVCMFVRIPVNN